MPKDVRDSQKIAVIDIGSNSVRMVVYDQLKRVPLSLFNEKKACRLALDLEHSGKLYPQGVTLALQALERFALIARAMNVSQIWAVATSAVRDAKDGMAFIAEVTRRTGFDISVLTGEEEARLSGLGVASSFFETNGVVGDIGGGSLELVPIQTGPETWQSQKALMKEARSFPIGALRLFSASRGQIGNARAIAHQALGSFPLQTYLKDQYFYAVGGGFRALGKLFMTRQRYPLQILHHYRVPASEMLTLLDWILTLTPKQIAKQKLASEERLDTLLYTAAVFEAILREGQPRYVLFSAYGLREGLLFDQLPAKEQHADPLIAAASDIIQHISPHSTLEWVEFGHHLHVWTSTLFENEEEHMSRLRLAACIMSRLSWYEHTSYRAEMAFRWIMDSSLPALNHKERTFVALAVYHRYRNEPDKSLMASAHKLLDHTLCHQARVLGLAMQLAYKFSGGASSILQQTELKRRSKDTLILALEKGASDTTLLCDSALKRLDTLGDLIGCDTAVR